MCYDSLLFIDFVSEALPSRLTLSSLSVRLSITVWPCLDQSAHTLATSKSVLPFPDMTAVLPGVHFCVVVPLAELSIRNYFIAQSSRRL